MTTTYTISKNSNSKPVKVITEALNQFKGLKVVTESIEPFKTRFIITSKQKMTSESLIATGAIIGAITAVYAQNGKG